MPRSTCAVQQPRHGTGGYSDGMVEEVGGEMAEDAAGMEMAGAMVGRMARLRGGRWQRSGEHVGTSEGRGSNTTMGGGRRRRSQQGHCGGDEGGRTANVGSADVGERVGNRLTN